VGHANEGDLAPPLVAEAQSPSRAQDDNHRDFQSAIAYAVAATALIAAIQEYLNENRRRRRKESE
jgi:hypothetical protein